MNHMISTGSSKLLVVIPGHTAYTACSKTHLEKIYNVILHWHYLYVIILLVVNKHYILYYEHIFLDPTQLQCVGLQLFTAWQARKLPEWAVTRCICKPVSAAHTMAVLSTLPESSRLVCLENFRQVTAD